MLIFTGRGTVNDIIFTGPSISFLCIFIIGPACQKAIMPVERLVYYSLL